MKYEIEVGIVETNVPLLISGKKLEEWGAIIDFRQQTIKLGKYSDEVRLQKTRTDHFVINMAKNVTENKDDVIKEILVITREKKYTMKDLKKLHKVL